MAKATMVIETHPDEDTTIRCEFDPPIDPQNPTLCEHLVCVALKAMSEETAELIADRDSVPSGTTAPVSTTESTNQQKEN